MFTDVCMWERGVDEKTLTLSSAKYNYILYILYSNKTALSYREMKLEEGGGVG